MSPMMHWAGESPFCVRVTRNLETETEPPYDAIGRRVGSQTSTRVFVGNEIE